ncbi:unnamed protein product [Aphanomyces euteiches]
MEERAQLLNKDVRRLPSRSLKYVAVAAFGLAGLIGTLFAFAAFHSNSLPSVPSSSASSRKNVCLTSRFLSLGDLKRCVHAIPYNASEKAIVLEHIRRTVSDLKPIPSYAFIEAAKSEHSFGPYTLPPVDLEAEFNAIAAKDFDTDLDLQDAIYGVFRKLQDAHTSYHKPTLYAQFYALLPASLISFQRGDAQIIQMGRPDATEVSIYKTFFSDDGHDFDVVGWDVVAIDGAPALDALRDFANNRVGLLKDSGTRFNLAVSGFGTGRGWFVYRPLSTLELPTESSVEFTLVNPSTNATKVVKYNWIGLNGIATPGRAPETSPIAKLEHLFQRLVRHMLYHDLFEPSPEVSYDDSIDQVGVLKIAAFSSLIDQDESEFLPSFVANVTDALTQFTRANKTTLIIDLTGNGGGDICLGYATIRYLFPFLDIDGPHESVGPHTRASYHLRHSALFDLLATRGAEVLHENPLACGSEFCPTSWYSAKTQRQFLTEEWMTKTNTTSSLLGNVSQPVYFGCGSSYDYFPAPGSNFKGLDRDHVILVSHGYCGSTCSVFSSFLQLHDLAQTVAFGGYANTPQQFFSFPGGQVYNTDAIYNDAGVLGVDSNELVPQPLSNISDLYADSSVNFAMLAITPWKEQNDAALPLEYKFVPATYSPLFPHSPYNATAMYTRAFQIVQQRSL